MTNSKLQEQAISIKLCRVTDHLSSRMGLSFLLDIWLYRENITCPSEDKNFIFEYSTRYCTSECSERVRYRVEHEKIKFISTSGHVIFCLSYRHHRKRRNLLCNHNDGDRFTCEDNMLFPRVKIWSFRAKPHLVFHWCLYNKYLTLTTKQSKWTSLNFLIFYCFFFMSLIAVYLNLFKFNVDVFKDCHKPIAIFPISTLYCTVSCLYHS